MQEVQDTRVWFLGPEDPLEKEMATHSSLLAWKPHGQRSLVVYNPQGQKELHNWSDLARTHEGCSPGNNTSESSEKPSKEVVAEG